MKLLDAGNDGEKWRVYLELREITKTLHFGQVELMNRQLVEQLRLSLGTMGSSKFTDTEIEGSIVTNRLKGRISLNENYDNLLVFRHPNGNKAVEFGIVNGEAALIWYNENNEEVWRGGISGIEYKNYVAASWSERSHIHRGFRRVCRGL